MSWFTKYRPRQISELQLVTVREQFLRLMNSGSFPHALLFAGPKGTGKTSSARIVAAMLNDPQNEKAVDAIFFGGNKKQKVVLVEPNPDDQLINRIFTGDSFMVNEMDAASNRGIDDIRRLKERLVLPPQEGKVSVYILDEVHMLTTDAFNALLKVLEEPPKHVVFVLATTELHKVPATIVSRCTQIAFHRANTDEIVVALTNVLEQEKIKFEPTALKLIAQRSEGSFRDAVKLLETVAQGQPIVDEKLVTTVLLDNTNLFIDKLLQSLLAKDAQAVTLTFDELRKANLDSQFFFAEWLRFLHQQLLAAIGLTDITAQLSDKVAHFILTEFSQLPAQDGPIPFLAMELKALDIIYRSQSKKTPPPETPPPSAKILIKKPTPTLTLPPLPSKQNTAMDAVIGQSVPEGVLTNHNGDGQQLMTRWAEFLDRLKNYNLSLELLLRSAQPVAGSLGKATIQVFYQFHKEQLQQPKFMNIIQECVQSVIGSSLDLEIVVAHKKTDQENANIKAVADSDLVELAKDLLV